MLTLSARLCGLCALVGVVGCGGSKPPPRPISVEPIVSRDVHPVFKGTIGAEGQLRGVQPVLVSGLGLVVGLNGTGGDVLAENVAATMEREMGLMGVGKEDSFRGTALEGKSPRQVLRDANIAVVVVQAAIPPGSPANATFDVFVKAVNATSLEGGTLWTADLRLGSPTVFGGVQTKAIAKARGPVFINPFSERGEEAIGVTRTVGRVLGGGWVSDPFDLELVLDSNSHARARAVVSAINGRFPQGPGDPDQTARGRNVSDAGGSLALRIPRRYRLEPGQFLELVMHLPIDPSFPEQQAKRLVDTLVAEPVLAEDVSWSLEALGNRALPFIRELYEHPELAPRMAGLKAGARLNDAIAAGPLKEVARTGPGTVRTRAIELLGDLDGGPSVDVALRELLSEGELMVRVAAYEALAKRATRIQMNRMRAAQEMNPDRVRLSPTRMEVLAQARWPRRNFQGIERREIEGKFFLDIVPFGEPVVYVTQQGQPRIVMFGEDLGINRPTLVSAWGERLLISAEGNGPVRVRYQPVGGGQVMTGEGGEDLVALVEYLARDPGPGDERAGLSMSYSDVVGALSAMCANRGTRAAFATELDRLKALIAGAGESQDAVERPARPGEAPIVLHERAEAAKIEDETPAKRPKVVPIVPPTKD